MQDAMQALRALRPGAVMEESELAAMVEKRLVETGVPHVREARLGPRCRVDFWLFDGTALEVKAKISARRAVEAQLLRYARCPQVTSVLLVTNQAFSLPRTLAGKPALVMNLKRLWGIAL